MRKYLIGICIGAALTISTSAFAEDVITLIGQKIQGEFPVKINGAALEKPAIVINGTSYLPNRAIADALGMDIKFDADLGIELTNKEVPMASIIENNQTVTETVYSEPQIDLAIYNTNNFITMMQMTIASAPDNEEVLQWQAQLKQYQDELAIWEARKAALSQ